MFKNLFAIIALTSAIVFASCANPVSDIPSKKAEGVAGLTISFAGTNTSRAILNATREHIVDGGVLVRVYSDEGRLNPVEAEVSEDGTIHYNTIPGSDYYLETLTIVVTDDTLGFTGSNANSYEYTASESDTIYIQEEVAYITTYEYNPENGEVIKDENDEPVIRFQGWVCKNDIAVNGEGADGYVVTLGNDISKESCLINLQVQYDRYPENYTVMYRFLDGSTI